MIKGIDISHWEGRISGQVIKDAQQTDDIYFTIMKASEGTEADYVYKANRDELNNYHCLWGAYHYFRPIYDSVAQIDFFHNLTKDSPLPPLIDMELWPGDTEDVTYYTRTPKKDIKYKVKKFFEGVNDAFGRPPIIYTNVGFWDEYLGDNEFSKLYRLWVANYDAVTPKLPRDWKDYIMWQYTAKGRINGIYADLDMNIFNGTLEELYQLGNNFVPDNTPPDDNGDEGLKKAEVLINNLRIREAPTTNARIVGYLNMGDKPDILEKVDMKVETRIDTWIRCGWKQWFALVLNTKVYAREL